MSSSGNSCGVFMLQYVTPPLWHLPNWSSYIYFCASVELSRRNPPIKSDSIRVETKPVLATVEWRHEYIGGGG